MIYLFQDLLASRKKKLQITEEILVEKSEEKKMMERNVEKMKRRESHAEKELLERSFSARGGTEPRPPSL